MSEIITIENAVDKLKSFVGHWDTPVKFKVEGLFPLEYEVVSVLPEDDDPLYRDQGRLLRDNAVVVLLRLKGPEL